MLTIEKIRPFSVLITVDRARMPAPGPLLSSWILGLVGPVDAVGSELKRWKLGLVYSVG